MADHCRNCFVEMEKSCSSHCSSRFQLQQIRFGGIQVLCRTMRRQDNEFREKRFYQIILSDFSSVPWLGSHTWRPRTDQGFSIAMVVRVGTSELNVNSLLRKMLEMD
jgi:hypothetical protein